jgi:hypothetical protein
MITEPMTSAEWNAWINKQPIQSTNGGTLHVTGQVTTHPSNAAFLVKRIPQGINPRILLLEIVLYISVAPTKQPQLVHYQEPLENDGQISSIQVFYKDEEVVEITDIPVIV